jgi:molecular chaperone GrpE
MTGTRKHIPINGQPAEADDPSAAAARPPGSGPAFTASPNAGEKKLVTEEALLKDEIEALRKERDLLVDQELRLRAEFENFRKRASREGLEARERAQGQLLGELLPVLDNLERALDAAEHHDEGKVLGGVRMVRDMFVDLLRRTGVEEIETVGAAFDPNVHDAMLMQPSEHAEGTVTAVLERGFRLGDRVLRPARVIVSAGSAEAGGRG